MFSAMLVEDWAQRQKTAAKNGQTHNKTMSAAVPVLDIRLPRKNHLFLF